MGLKGISKRTLSILLALIMTVGLVTSALAVDKVDEMEELIAIDDVQQEETVEESEVYETAEEEASYSEDLEVSISSEPIDIRDESGEFDVFGDYEDELAEYQPVSSIEQYGSTEKAYEALKGDSEELAVDTYSVKPLATVGNIYAYWDNSSHTLTFTNGTSSASGDKYDLTYYNGDEADLPWRGTYPNYNEHYSDISLITSIVIADDIYPGNMAKWFDGFGNASFSGLSKIHTDYCTDLSYVFYYCNLNQSNMSDIANWNTSNVKDASWIFGGNKNIQSIDLSLWDLSSAENIGGLFDGCSSVTTITLPSSSSRAPHAKDMYVTFSGCTSLTTINNLSLVNTSNATDMWGIFMSDTSLSGTLDLSNWDFSNVQDFSEAFYDCEKLGSVKFPSSSSKSMHSLITAGSAFYKCYSLESVDNIGLWDITTVDCSSSGMLNGIDYLFDECRSLKSIDLSSWDFSNSNGLHMMFYRCFSLESAKFPTNTATGPRESTDAYTALLGGFFATFYDCYSLKELDLSGFTFVNDVYSSWGWADFLNGCSSLEKVTFGSGLKVGMALPWSYNVNGWNECWYNSGGTKYTAENNYSGYVIPSGAGTYYSYDRNHTHSWTGDFWWPYFDDEWNYGYDETYCTVHLTCSGCLTEDYGYCDIAKTTFSADCTDYGEIVYTAMYSSSLGGNSVSTVRTIITAQPLGHNYQFVSSSFNSDYSSGTISIKCSRCGDTETIYNCTVTTTGHKDPTCTDSGYTNYKISGTYDGQTFSDTKTTTSSALKHSYDLMGASADIEFSLVSSDADTYRQAIVAYAENLVYMPYLVGGRGDTIWKNAVNDTGSDLVFDCSGLTQYVYKNALAKKYDLSIVFSDDDEARWTPETQWDYQYAYDISPDGMSSWDQFIPELKRGDLIFFNKQASGYPGHVGIYVGNGEMVDANVKKGVTYENLAEEREFSTVMGAKRLIAGTGEQYSNVGTVTYECSRCGDVIVDSGLTVNVSSCKEPTCSSTGSVTYGMTSTASGRTSVTTATNTIPKTAHITNYTNAIATFNYIEGTADLHSTCVDCDEPITTYGLKADYDYSYTDYDNDTGEYGIMVLGMSLSLMDEDGEQYTYQDEIPVEDAEEVESSHVWLLDEKTYIETTCTENGYSEYICDECGAVKTVESEATGHYWNVEFIWSDNYTECTARFTCMNCGETEDVQAVITSETDGDDIIYTATATFNGFDYQEIMIVNAEKDEDKDEPETTVPSDNGNDNDGSNDTHSQSSEPETESEPEEAQTVEIDHYEETAEEAGKSSTVTVTDADTSESVSDDTTGQSATSNYSGASSGSSGTSTTSTSSNSSGESGTSTTDAPKTGDNLSLWIGIAGVVALAGIGAVVTTNRKKESE